MARVFIYSRVSTSRQSAGLGLSRQMDLVEIRKWAEEEGHSISDLDIMKDFGSGLTGENLKPEAILGAFLKRVKDKEIEPGSFLVVDHLNRLTRQDILTAVGLLTLILAAGINIRTNHDKRIYSEADPNIGTDLMMAIMWLMEGNKSSLEKRRVALYNHQKKREAAIQIRQVSTRMLPAWLSIKYADVPRLGTKLTVYDKPVPNEKAKIVKRIFTEVADGMGCYTVAKRLNNEHIPPLNGGKQKRDEDHNPIGPVSELWSTGAVAKLIANDAPLGLYQPHVDRKPVGEPIKDYYPRIIEKTLADRARAQISSRQTTTIAGGKTVIRPSHAGRKGVHYSNLFSGIAKCGVCAGSTFLYNFNPKRGNHGSLRCTNAIRSDDDDKCSNRVGIPYKLLEERIIATMPWFIEVRNDSQDDPLKQIREDVALRQTDIDRITKSIAALLDTFGTENQMTDVAERIARLNRDRAVLEKDKADLERTLAIESSELSTAAWDRAQFMKRMASPDQQERYTARSIVAGILRGLLKRIECNADKTVTVGVMLKNKTLAAWKIDLENPQSPSTYRREGNMEYSGGFSKVVPAERMIMAQTRHGHVAAHKP
jgi:DNA invertase Pin-like site-specific DNA recombinase